MNKDNQPPQDIIVPEHLFQIARMIKKDWKEPYFGAVPYLKAMQSMSHVGESFDMDSGVSIVRYFLANANTWRGPVARAVKLRLNQMIKSK
jgi:hypothetical protein